MGSNDGEDYEQPIHQVCLKGFYLGKYEVTRAQYHQVIGYTADSNDNPDDRPVSNISWWNVGDFIKKLHSSGGTKLRLPSEAEWEYACLADGKHKSYCGSGLVDRLAGHDANSNKLHPVGKLRSNDFGIHDMSGNVLEWVEDRYHSNYQVAPLDDSAWLQNESQGLDVLRGGSHVYSPRDLRASARIHVKQTIRSSNFGFRLARSL